MVHEGVILLQGVILLLLFAGALLFVKRTPSGGCDDRSRLAQDVIGRVLLSELPHGASHRVIEWASAPVLGIAYGTRDPRFT